MIPDKYHTEWVIRDMKIDVRIFKAQSLAFHFLSDMAYDLDNSIEIVKRNKTDSYNVNATGIVEKKMLLF